MAMKEELPDGEWCLECLMVVADSPWTASWEVSPSDRKAAELAKFAASIPVSKIDPWVSKQIKDKQ